MRDTADRFYLRVNVSRDLSVGRSSYGHSEERAGARDGEAKVQHLLALFTHIDLDFAIAWRGGEIRRQYHTRLADALIAATALRHHLRLATRNLQHFSPIEGLQVEKPYD